MCTPIRAPVVRFLHDRVEPDHRLEGAATVFGKDRAEEQGKVDVTRMQAKIGELALANDF